jgi:hypothetical protein
MSTEVMFRVDVRPINPQTFSEHIGRVESISATGCTILTRWQPKAGAEVELRLYLPSGSWPIRVDHAQVTWGHWNSFAVEFLSMPSADKAQLQDYLLHAATPAAV